MICIMEEIYGLDSFADEEAPRLSFCDLPMAENSSGPTTHELAQPDHLFEFFAPPPAAAAAADVILFGKFIKVEEECKKRGDYFAATKSRSSFSDRAAAEKRRLSASSRVTGDLVRPKADVNYHMQSVNFSSLTSMSAKSRRRMFMFGPVKFKPEMELSAIKQRQATRPPAPLKPPPAPSGGGKSRWGLVKSSLRGRSHLTTVLARWIPAACGGVDRWVGVAD